MNNKTTTYQKPLSVGEGSGVRLLKTILLALLIITSIKVFSQPPNENPLDYTLVFEDEFDVLHDNLVYDKMNDIYYHTDIDITKWKSTPRYNQRGEVLFMASDNVQEIQAKMQYAYHKLYFENAEVDISGSGTVKLIVKKEDYYGYANYKVGDKWHTAYRWFFYTSQMLYSKQSYEYGYYEIKFKVPQPSPSNKKAIQGIGPNFWLYGGTNKCYDSWSEIDIFEIDGLHYRNITANSPWEIVAMKHDLSLHNDLCSNINYGISESTYTRAYQNLITNNVHIQEQRSECPTASDTAHYEDGYKYLVDGIFSDNNFHTIGAKWLPNSISFYIDGVLINNFDINIVNPTDLLPMNMLVDINFPALNFEHFIDEYYVDLPYEYEIDYVKIWSLNNCHTSDKEICNTTPNNSIYLFDDKVTYKKLTVSGSNCQEVNIEPGVNMDMKASEEIRLKPGFHAKAGSNFRAHIVKCETIIE